MSEETSKKADSANAVNITNTRVACCLHALGFHDWKADAVQKETGGPMQISFMFRGESSRPEFAGKVLLNHAKALLSGQLEKMQPMHPLCVMMRGIQNQSMLAEASLTGRSLRLVGVAGGQMTVYAFGVLPSSFYAPALSAEILGDHDLVAALGGVGLPVVRIEGAPPFNRYHVARTGYALETIDEHGKPGALKFEDAFELATRSETKEDPLRLLKELTDPLHPVCLMYDALFVRAWMAKELAKIIPLLLLGGEGKRQALVTLNATGRVMERATSHLKAPPLNWGK